MRRLPQSAPRPLAHLGDCHLQVAAAPSRATVYIPPTAPGGTRTRWQAVRTRPAGKPAESSRPAGRLTVGHAEECATRAGSPGDAPHVGNSALRGKETAPLAAGSPAVATAFAWKANCYEACLGYRTSALLLLPEAVAPKGSENLRNLTGGRRVPIGRSGEGLVPTAWAPCRAPNLGRPITDRRTGTVTGLCDSLASMR
jgi:hypothetical protein